MKVYISSYGNRYTAFGIQDWLMVKRHTKEVWWQLEPEQFDRYDTFVEKTVLGLQWILDHTINLITDRPQKVKVRIDDYDVWSADITLAHIIHPILVKLNEVKHGSPSVDDEDVPEELRSTSAPPKENEYDTDENFHKRWNWVMNEMIWAFEALVNSEQEHLKFYDEVKGTWDFDTKKLHDDRISNGLRLFGKYYRSLWD